MENIFEALSLEDIFILESGNKYETQLAQQCFNIVGVFIVAVDLNGNITLINNKGREILGYEEDELIGKNFIQNFIEKKSLAETELQFAEVIQGKTSYPENTKYHLITKTGQLKIIEAKNIIIRDRKNKLLGILISGEDITGYLNYQRELKKDINLYHILANSIPEINLFLFDKKLRFIIAEGNEMKNHGLASDAFVDRTVYEIGDQTLKHILIPLFNSAVSGKEISSEFKYNNYEYLIRVIPLKSNKHHIYGGIAITQNITEIRKTEEKLKKSREISEKANRAKSEFLARVSHEIRTPLNAILGFSEQLMQTDLNKLQKDYVSIIDKSSEHLLSLINDILVISKIEASKIIFDKLPFKIEYVVNYVYQSLATKADDKKLSFTYKIDENLNQVLIGDSFRLQQILINILNNAIKFTHKGFVELKCKMKSETKNRVEVLFEVSDSGIGISPEKLTTIFEQFKQADASITMKYGGTGLGLTISKNLIEMQKGSLSVSSKKGKGTIFTFIIPYKKGKETDIVHYEMHNVDSTKLRNKKVLLVDDDSINLLLGKTILEKFRCRIDIAANGNEAKKKLRHKKFDIILLDIHLPDISGLDVTRYLRDEKQNNSTKIIAVTAAAMKDDIQGYFRVGINDFLIKPFREINLFNKMCEVLNIEHRNYEHPKAEIILKEEVNIGLYDLSDLERMANYNKDIIKTMLKTFIENSESAIKLFHKYLKDNNWQEIGETAHRILPSYRHLKVENLVTDLFEIKEKALINPDYKEIPVKISKTIDEMNSVVRLLKEEMNRIS